MKNRQRAVRSIHAWLGLITGIQLLFWCTGGLVFSTHDIEWVRGNHGRDTSAPATLQPESIVTSPADAIAASGFANVREVTLTTLLRKPVYRLTGEGGAMLVDAVSGNAIKIDEARAQAIAQADRAEQPEVTGAKLITADAPTEFRGRTLPAWQVKLADANNTHIYVDQATGAVVARRNDAWRRFDFFWMLHTMDYSGRDNFNTPWLIVFSVLGLLSVSSGWGIWVFRVARSRKQQPA
ncbi:MAG: PepSY domain-containing protein [Verrucomicrobiota bacterium]|jgi:uncharacterized iron-regulated membrane protein|nr:PepSY domain-containing protein [Verrucomicrobiota bacterium]MDP7048700.1 PepSY domain-containing protein [Verrucomicrobiota bacterium]